jgi:UDP-N-acetylmuramoylalanine--D-glutamate ligase
MNIRGRSFSVVGMGRSGLAAAAALVRRGGDVLVSDGRDTPQLREAVAALPGPVTASLGREAIRPGDVAVLSPGIPPDAPAFREAHRVASEVIGEVELFFRLCPSRIVAVTGTDGKSTVTTLTAHLLAAAGLMSHAAGNLGNPLCDLLDTLDPRDVVVAEVSCFQLLTCTRFRPEVALVTNLAEDHLEHHGSYAAYLRAKARVAAAQAIGDTFVRNLDDPCLAGWIRPDSALAPDNGQRVLDISRRTPVTDGAFLRDGALCLAHAGAVQEVCPRAAFPLVGGHNTENALLALAACLPFEPRPEALAAGLATYSGLPHRIEFVRELDGVRYYNDSKATNPHAAITALRAFDEPVILIAGGYEKDLPLRELSEEVGRRCRAVVLAGACSGRMDREFPASVPRRLAPDLESAVHAARDLASPGGVVLFSPAASSFDQFRNFEERGDRFREIVRGLTSGNMRRTAC